MGAWERIDKETHDATPNEYTPRLALILVARCFSELDKEKILQGEVKQKLRHSWDNLEEGVMYYRALPTYMHPASAYRKSV
jgi:hypothetical protein